MQTEIENTENKEIMYAIVDIAGQQFKVAKNQKLFVHRISGDTGTDISFDKVLLIENEGKITVGNPVIKNAAVSAKVLDHVKGDKVLVFKKKRRKGYQKLNGHRQYLTQIEITGIDEKAPAKKAAPTKAEAPKKAEEAKPAETATKAASAEDKKPAVKSTAAKKTEEKKPAAKKTAAKPAANKESKSAAAKSAAAKPAAKKEAASEKKDKPADSGKKADTESK